MKNNATLLRSFFAVAAMMCAGPAAAAIHKVSSIPDLQAAIDSAVAGDTVVVHNGVYMTSAFITVNRQGTATNPIRIIAQTIGGVEITGTNVFNVDTLNDDAIETVVYKGKQAAKQLAKGFHRSSPLSLASATRSCVRRLVETTSCHNRYRTQTRTFGAPPVLSALLLKSRAARFHAPAAFCGISRAEPLVIVRPS